MWTMVVGLITILGAVWWTERDRFAITWRIREWANGGEGFDRTWLKLVRLHRGRQAHRMAPDQTGTYTVPAILRRNGK